MAILSAGLPQRSGRATLAASKSRSGSGANRRPGANVMSTLLCKILVTRASEFFLRRRDLDAFLLAGIGHIADGGALHVALPAQIVELGSPMHRTAIVPHDEVVDPPAMGIDELPLRRVRG